MIEHSSGNTFKLLTGSRLRLGLTLIITLMVISSPIFMLANPASASSSFSTDSNTSAPSTIGQDGSDFTTQAALSSLTARPTNNIVNTNSFYDVVFLAATSGTIKMIEVTFPAGTTIPSGAFFNEAEGIGPGTASKSGQTITYTVTNAVNVPAGTKIRLEFANINNPLNPNSAYQVTVTTRDAANTPIDGPTPSTAYTIKQIGANAIADNSITSTKPAESFMKRVSVFDLSGGHAVGWDPNGATTTFTISEPAITNVDASFPTIAFRNAGNVVCVISGFSVSFQTFSLACITAPPNGSELHYVIENLPPHIIQ